MPTISGRMPWNPTRADPCVWCGSPAVTLMRTPGRPDLHEVPLHLICAAQVNLAYQDWKAGRLLTPEQQDGMRRLNAGGP